MTVSRVAAVFVVAFALAACATQTPKSDAPAKDVASEQPVVAQPVVERPVIEKPAVPQAEVAQPEVDHNAAPAPKPKPPHVYWAVRMLPGPAWVAGKPADDQPGIDAHVENLEKWNARGLVFAAGPFMDGAGGLTVLRAKSAKEAQALADEDPCVKSGVLKPEIHPWLCVFRSGD